MQQMVADAFDEEHEKSQLHEESQVFSYIPFSNASTEFKMPAMVM